MAEEDDYLTEYSASSSKRKRSTVVPNAEPQPVVHGQQGKKKSAAPQKKGKLLGIVLSFAFLLGVVGVTTWLIANRSTEYLESRVVVYDGQPLLLQVDEEYSYSKSEGRQLTGYVLILTDIASQKELHRLDVNADGDLNTTPAELYVYGADNIWLIKMKANMAGSKGLLNHYKISGNTIVPVADEQKGLIPSRMTSGQHLVLADEFNEVHCFDLRALTVSDGECPYIAAKDTAGAAFFSSVANVGATRCKVYYFREAADAPDTVPEIAITFSGAALSLGYEVLAMNRQQMTDDELNAYQTTLDSAEVLSALNNGAYFYNLQFVERTPEYVLFSHTEENSDVRYYSCYNAEGKLLWQVTHDILQETPGYRLSGYSETVNNVMYVTVPYSWTFAVDLKTNKLLWVYPGEKFNTAE